MSTVSIEKGGSRLGDGDSSSIDSRGSSQSSIKGDEPPARRTWGGRFEFVLTLIGYAVGLGNIWRFPFLSYRNGGGAFLIPYMIFLFTFGFPLFYLEVGMGQFASLAPIKIWAANPLFKGLGISMVLTASLAGCYYNIVVNWSLYYLYASMASEVPWATCGNSWNTEYCVKMSDMGNITGNYTLPSGEVVPKSELKSPSEEYFYNGVLKSTSGLEEMGGIVWQLAMCLLQAWIIVFIVLFRGIATLGKAVYFTSLFPYVLLTIMLVRGATLDGAGDGVLYYIKPDFNRLGDVQVWSDAATQIFFSLSLATGGQIAMASFNKFHNNFFRDCMVVPVINFLTSFYAGFAIFTVLGYMAKQKDVPISQVATGGPGLVFVVYPEALAAMPVSPLWSILFFFMMATLGLSTMFSIAETFFVSITDEFPTLSKSLARDIGLRVAGCVLFYLIGLSMVTQAGYYVLTLIDSYLSGFPFLFLGLFEIAAIPWVYGYKRYEEDFQLMLGDKPWKPFKYYFRICLCVLAPIALLGTLIFMAVKYTTPTDGGYTYPTWAEGIGFTIVSVLLLPIPIWMIGYLIYKGLFRKNFIQLLKESIQPTPQWKPALKENQIGRYASVPQTFNSGLADSSQGSHTRIGKKNSVGVMEEGDVVESRPASSKSNNSRLGKNNSWYPGGSNRLQELDSNSSGTL